MPAGVLLHCSIAMRHSGWVSLLLWPPAVGETVHHTSDHRQVKESHNETCPSKAACNQRLVSADTERPGSEAPGPDTPERQHPSLRDGLPWPHLATSVP